MVTQQSHRSTTRVSAVLPSHSSSAWLPKPKPNTRVTCQTRHGLADATGQDGRQDAHFSPVHHSGQFYYAPHLLCFGWLEGVSRHFPIHLQSFVMIFIPVPQSEAGASPLPPPSRCPQSQTSPGPSSSLRPQRQRKPSAAAREANANGTGPAVSSRQSTASSTTSPNQTSPLSSVSPPSSTRSTPEISVPPFAVDSPALQRDLARVWEAINGSRRIVVVCGQSLSSLAEHLPHR